MTGPVTVSFWAATLTEPSFVVAPSSVRSPEARTMSRSPLPVMSMAAIENWSNTALSGFSSARHLSRPAASCATSEITAVPAAVRPPVPGPVKITDGGATYPEPEFVTATVVTPLTSAVTCAGVVEGPVGVADANV